jgi:hypothetical protein
MKLEIEKKSFPFDVRISLSVSRSFDVMMDEWNLIISTPNIPFLHSLGT